MRIELLMRSKKFLNIKDRARKYAGFFYALIVIPVSSPDQFLALKYSKLKPNEVSVGKNIVISVDNSASPLFYKIPEIKPYGSIEIEGQTEIETRLSSEKNDAYFQLGIIYEGDYRPSWLTKKLLPEWILKIINLNDQHGLSDIDFHHFKRESGFEKKSDSIRDIRLNFIQAGEIDESGKFRATIKLQNKKILGLWLRADGDDHQGKFKTTVSKLTLF